jgi:hypothetical protein
MNLPLVLVRRLAYTLAIIPVFLFSGAAATFCLYAACMFYELLYAKDNWKYSTPLWMIAVIFLPFGWQAIYLTSNEGLFDLLFAKVEGIKYVPLLLLAFTPFCIFVFGLAARKQLFVKAFRKIFSVIFILLLTGCGYYLFSKTVNRLEEQKFGMNIATSQNNWDQVLKISEQVKHPDQQTVFFTNLALSMKGELPQKMFLYPQTDEFGLLIIRITDEFYLRYGSDFYYHIGILNEAIRWIFDAYIMHRNGMNYHALTRLAKWNHENGYKTVASKYFDILDETLMYRSWAKQQRKAPVPQREKSAFTQIEHYIGGREPIYDLAYHYENNPQNHLTLDYLLCCLLLKNDLEKFMNVFVSFYPSSSKIPMAYQEALLALASLDKIDIRNYQIDKNNEDRFRSFTNLVNKGNVKELKKQFSNTWWYYSYRASKKK